MARRFASRTPSTEGPRASARRLEPGKPRRDRDASGRGRDTLILTLFFMSGASGLIYEILFSRILHLLMGSTVYSITTVLTAFMGGLALGAFVAGRKASTLSHPVRAYAICELFIGLLALAVPALLWLLTPVFRLLYAHVYSTFLAWNLMTFVLCALVLLPPTTLMGATLPILTEGLTRRGDLVGRSAGKLYAVNTLGAFLGAALAGFVLIPNIGQLATLLVGFSVNIGLFAAIMRFYPAAPGAMAPPRPVVPAPSARETEREIDDGEGAAAIASPRAVRLVVGSAYAVSGFAAMLYQVGWTRAIALSLGSSTYTFSIIVAAFIFGLAIGAMVMARLADRLRQPLLWFAWIEIGVGVSAAAVLPLFGHLPIYAYQLIGKYRDSFGWRSAMEFLLLFGLICVPTFLMGALFPLSTRLLQSTLTSRSGARAVGTTYAVNTLGTIAGAFGMGFVLIPLIGVQAALLVASVLNVTFGALAFLLPWPPTLLRGVTVVVLLVALRPLSHAIPSWDRWLMISGPYLLDPQFMEAAKQEEAPEGLAKAKDKIAFFVDDPNVNVAVLQVGDGYALKLNGKTDASTFQDMPTQRLAGHLPLLLHPDAKDVCVIGMGSGVTGGCAAAHPSVARLDQVEIARAVIDAGRFFAKVNHNILQNPRVRFIEADGRVHILFSPATYDVIVSEPSNPWIAGIGNLFTVDYFKESGRRLKPGGIMSAWIQTYRMSREGFLTVLRSFRKAFPDMTVWTASAGDLILLGSHDGVTVDLNALRTRLKDESIEADMKALLIQDPADLISHMVLTPPDLDRLTTEGTRLNTDNNGWLEFHAPKALYSSENVLKAAEALSITSAAELPLKVLGDQAAKDELAARLPGIFRAKRKALEAEDAMEEGDIARTERLARDALSLNEREHHATMILSEILTRETRELMKNQQYAVATPKLEELARIYPTYPQLPYQLAEAYLRQGRYDAAMPWLDRLQVQEPSDPTVLYNRAIALISLGRPAEAIPALKTVIQQSPDDAESLLALGNAQMAMKDYASAVDSYDRALRVRPQYFEAQYNRATALWGMGQIDQALFGFQELEAQGARNASVPIAIARLELEKKAPDKAILTLAPLLQANPDVPQVRLIKAQALLMAGKPQDAIADYEWLAEKAPRALQVWLELGDAYRALGNSAKARDAYGRASALDAEKTRAYLKNVPGF